MTSKLKLPPEVGKREKLRKDGTYGYVCNACGYPVGDHDGYCSECGARVAGTYFYYGKDCKPDEKPKIPLLEDILYLRVGVHDVLGNAVGIVSGNQ